MESSGPAAEALGLPLVAAPAPSPAPMPFVEQALADGVENESLTRYVYLVRISRVLASAGSSTEDFRDLTQTTREQVAEALKDSLDHPVNGARGGRPRAAGAASHVMALVVFRELHADKSTHFHVAVRLDAACRFMGAKRALRERHGMPSHWSCTHSQMWSALRYCIIPSPTKLVVDSAPHQWTHDNCALDLFESSREPFQAGAWRKRREERDKSYAALQKKATFTKLDLTSLIVSKQLRTKDALLAYVQRHGTVAMQSFVSRTQRKLDEYIQDAETWAAAEANAASEKQTEWEIVCQVAAAPCPHQQDGSVCPYWEAAQKIFVQNSDTVCPRKLARALRSVLISGPSKQNRVPFLVGPSNSGKSTLLYPFDKLFSPSKVLHKPALGSTFALRNIAKKRFIFWDDYRPVEYAHEKTVPVSLFLSLFIGQPTEVQVSQAFSDGNLDVAWNKGVVFIAKDSGLWEPTLRVGEEDIQHMRNRVEEFHFTVVLPRTSLKDIEPCTVHMSKWIVSESAASDVGGTLLPMLPLAGDLGSAVRGAEDPLDQIAGYRETSQVARIPDAASQALLGDLMDLGAVDVKELVVEDWAYLPSWGQLRMLEKRRVLQHLFGAQASRSA